MDDQDIAELQLLARLHYALAAATALASLLAAPVIWLGASAMRQPSAAAVDEDYVAGLFSLCAGISWAALCLVHASALGYIGRLIRVCRRRRLVMIFSALHLINVPLGTALSIYAFSVLSRERVKRRFARSSGNSS